MNSYYATRMSALVTGSNESAEQRAYLIRGVPLRYAASSWRLIARPLFRIGFIARAIMARDPIYQKIPNRA